MEADKKIRELRKALGTSKEEFEDLVSTDLIPGYAVRTAIARINRILRETA